MSVAKLSGVITAIGTPLGEGDRVDEAGLRRLTRYLVDAGVHGILSNGSMGGFAFLADDEQIRSVATTVAEANGAVPVIGGLGETSTSRAVRMARRIVAEGVDYLSVLPPFYFFATQEQLIAYFSEIAAAVDVPVFLYDNPVMTKNNIQPETVAELRRRVPRIVGIKVSNQDAVNLQNLLTLMKGDREFAVLTGSEFLVVMGLQMGCDGCVGGLYNLNPHMAVALYDAWIAGDMVRAAKLQQDVIATWQLFRRGHIWGAFDEALRHLGICERATGSPYVTVMTEEDRQWVRDILDRYVMPYLSVSAKQ
ncbi:MAG TPA: dihydrodipicolinate synthase family protein [Bryobacteraceae bacterium]|nr:dihydrodipicolinate synthase family protein [Bryobacteraceae bacterium]